MPRFVIGQDVWVLCCIGRVCSPPRFDIDPPDAFEIVGGKIISYRADKNSYEVKLNSSSMTPTYKEFEISASEKEAKGRLELYYDSLVNVYMSIVGYLKQCKQRHCKQDTAKKNVSYIEVAIFLLTCIMALLLFSWGFHEWALGIFAVYFLVRLFMELFDDSPKQ